MRTTAGIISVFFLRSLGSLGLFSLFMGLSACTGDFSPVGNPTLADGGEGGADADVLLGPLNYTDDIAPEIGPLCNGCHTTPDGTNGNYGTTTYAALLGSGVDGIANVIPGDATSRLIVYFGNGHQTVDSFRNGQQVIRSWIVDSNAAETAP